MAVRAGAAGALPAHRSWPASNSMGNRITRFANLTQRFGWMQGLGILFLWIARRTIRLRRAVVFRMDLKRIPALAGCDTVDWEYQSRDEGAADAPADSPRFLSADVRSFVGKLNGVQCYSSIVSSEGFRIPDRVTVRFNGSSEGYVGDCITVDEHRGRGIYPCGLVQLARQLRADGKSALYLFVEQDNLASLRSVRKAGFIPVATCSVWYVGRFCRRRWRPVPTNGAAWLSQWTVQTGPTGPATS